MTLILVSSTKGKRIFIEKAAGNTWFAAYSLSSNHGYEIRILLWVQIQFFVLNHKITNSGLQLTTVSLRSAYVDL